MSKEVKSQILSKVADLLDKFSDRLVRIANQTRQNTEAIPALREETLKWVVTLKQCLELTEKEAGEREAKQALRDQNNVQALVNLRDSTAKAFNQVRQDVEGLLKQIQRLNERVGQVESQNVILANRLNAPAPAPQMPSDHVWINKKLTGVYDSLTDSEKRIQIQEDKSVTPVKYMGYTVKARGNEIIIEDSVGEFTSFPLPEQVANFVAETYGILTTVKSGDKYIPVGGPDARYMYTLLYKKA